MSWRTVVSILVFVFIAIATAAIIGPILPQITGKLMATGDYNTSWMAGEDLVNGLVESWFQSILLAIFGLMAWGVAYVLRKELTRRGGM